MSSEVIRKPPSADGLGTGAVLALLVHLGLIAALAWGVSWHRRDATPVTAELWSAVPRLADAPAPAPVPPPPAPTPKPIVPPKPTVVEPKPAPPQPKEADIAVEKKPKKKDKEEPKKEEPKKPEPPKKEKEKEKDKEPDKKLEDRKKADAQAKEQAAEQARQDKAQAERAQKAREEQMRRLNAQLLGNGTGSGTAAGAGGGNAAQASAPSASYAGRIRARVKPNIIFSGALSGNPRAEVEVRVGPDGTILGSRLSKSSGQSEWDQAVLRAVERTEVLPRDTDGRVPPVMVLTFSPNDF